MVKTVKFICVVLSAVFMITACGLFTAMAEPMVDTPVETQVVTNPVETQAPETQAPTNPVTNPATAPQETTQGVTEAPETVAPETEFVRPTEFAEDYVPNTHSNYHSNASLYTPAEQDFEENDFEKLDEDEILNMALNSDSVDGLKDFNNIKNNNAKGDEVSPLLLILGLLLIFLSIAGFTFVFMYKDKPKKKAPAAAGKAPSSARGTSTRSTGTRYAQNPRTKERRSNSDYNDGY